MSDAILAATSGYKDMADGTLRLTVDVEPAQAEAALRLFRGRGTPIALARITNEAAVAHDRRRHETVGNLPAQDGEAGVPEHPSRPAASPSDPLPAHRVLPLTSKVALTCRDPEFWRFCRQHPREIGTAWCDTRNSLPVREGDDQTYIAEAMVKVWCRVQRKRDIEEDESARMLWRTLDRAFQQWRGSQELARRVGASA